MKARICSIIDVTKKKAGIVILCVVLIATASAGAVFAANAQSNTTGNSGNIAEPFQSIADELLQTCDFPVVLPTYFPSPREGNEWYLSPNTKNGALSIEIDQQPLGYTGQAHSLADWYGVIAGNVGEPSKQPLEKQFTSGNCNIAVNDISLPTGVKGMEYIDNPNAVGGTAITWEADQWSFFVTAYPDGDFSTTNYANQIINTIKDSGQALPGSNGRFYFIYNGNMPMTEVCWEVEPSIWYEIDSREPNDVIRILQSMKKLEANTKSTDIVPSPVSDPTSASGSDSIDILNKDTNFQNSGLEIQALTELVKIDRATAIKNAEASVGESISAEAKDITAVLVKLTQDTPLNPESPMYLKDYPAWIVTFHGVTLLKNGPGKPDEMPTVLADENVVIDANNGDVLESVAYSSTSSAASDSGAISAEELKSISNGEVVSLTDDSPAALWWIPKSQDTTLSEITSWLEQSKLYSGEIPSSQTSSDTVFSANVGPSVLYINTSDQQTITIRPAFYLVADGKGYKKSYLSDVLIFNDGKQVIYIQSSQLYDWLKDDQWKSEFEMKQ